MAHGAIREHRTNSIELKRMPTIIFVRIRYHSFRVRIYLLTDRLAAGDDRTNQEFYDHVGKGNDDHPDSGPGKDAFALFHLLAVAAGNNPQKSAVDDGGQENNPKVLHEQKRKPGEQVRAAASGSLVAGKGVVDFWRPIWPHRKDNHGHGHER